MAFFTKTRHFRIKFDDDCHGELQNPLLLLYTLNSNLCHYHVKVICMKPSNTPSIQNLNIIDIITAKRDNEQELSTEQIYWFIEHYSHSLKKSENSNTTDKFDDYQVSALLMAIFFNGMSDRETVDLTLAMAQSGDQIDLSDVIPFAVDKHSTGGVGDKTSLAVLPIVAACGVPVAKMSGRGLGHTGGTVDKLESITGFQVEVSTEKFKELAQQNGIVIVGQSANLAPADKGLYALRDVTATVESIPLIASSIMSKKLAAGADAVVLDVKVGEGAFAQTIEDARELAGKMVKIGVGAGRAMTAVISDMNQPLGYTAGHSLEVREAIETLRGESSPDFHEHCLTIASHMIVLSPYSDYQTFETAREAVEKSLHDGSALEKLRLMVEGQGGDVRQVDDPSLLPQASLQETISANQSGYIAQINALQVGRVIMTLGGGREKKGDKIDHAVGIETLVKVGDEVSAGEPLFRLHANDQAKLDLARNLVEQHCFSITPEPVEPLTLIHDVIAEKP